MYIYFTLTILTEHGTLSLFSWYLKAKLSLLMRFITYNFGQIDIFFSFKKKGFKISYFTKVNMLKQFDIVS